MTPEIEDLMHFFQESRRAADLSYRRWGLRLGITRQRMHQIVEHGVVGPAMARKILGDMADGPDSPFPEGVKETAQVLSRQILG